MCWGMESVNEVVTNIPPNCKMKQFNGHITELKLTGTNNM